MKHGWWWMLIGILVVLATPRATRAADPLFVEAEGVIVAQGSLEGQLFGNQVALDGDTAIVGARSDDNRGQNAGAAYVFVRVGDTWTQQAKLTAPDGGAFEHFGSAVAISGATAVVGAPDHSGMGAAYVFTRTGARWSLQAKLTAPDAMLSAAFGASVAVSGSTVIVGARGQAVQQGSAYVFVSSGGTWMLEETLLATDGAEQDQFGAAVAIDGETALVGAAGDDANKGSAYVFVRAGSTWSQQQKLLAMSGPGQPLFGQAVSLSGDIALIGAPGLGIAPGAAYLFFRNAGTWGASLKLVAGDSANGNLFGASVAVSATVTLVGAPQANGKGAAYRFNVSDGAPQEKIVSPDGLFGDFLGGSVALSANTALVGAPSASHESVESGVAWVFVSGTPTWATQGALHAADQPAGDVFGNALALRGDTAFAGAPFNADRGLKSGAIYALAWNGNKWDQRAKLSASDGAAQDQFGYAIALSEDTVVVGAPGSDPFGSGSGAAYVLTRVGGTWVEQSKLASADGAADERFGTSVSIAGDTIVVGAPAGNNVGPGKAYVFNRIGETWTVAGAIPSPDAAFGAQFGASVSLSGDTLLVGAPWANEKKGAAYLFLRDGTTWNLVKTFAGSDSESSLFGSVGVVSDERALIGAPLQDIVGAVYISERNGAMWTNLEKVTANNPEDYALFGWAVALGDSIVAIGSPLDTSLSAYLYVRSNGDWSAPGSQVSSNTINPGESFGSAVALSSDSTHLLIGAPNENTNGPSAGAVYAFTVRRDNGVPCKAAAQCQSGSCTEEVCCNTPCGGPCETCVATLKASGDDGFCGPVAEGLDPHESCPDDGPATCKRDGTCNGAGLCRLYAYGDVCGGSLCTGDFRHEQQICNGNGACIADFGTLESCLPYACTADDGEATCASSCDAAAQRDPDAACAKGFVCRNNACVPRSAECVDDVTSRSADGTLTPCLPFRCSHDTGTCWQVCASVDQCAPLHVCDGNKTCVPPEPQGNIPECGCSVPGSGTDQWTWRWAGLAVIAARLVIARQRRRRTAQRAGS